MLHLIVHGLELLHLQIEIVVGHLVTVGEVATVGTLFRVLLTSAVGRAKRLADVFANGIDKRGVTTFGEIDGQVKLACIILQAFGNLLGSKLIGLRLFCRCNNSC